MKPGQRRRLYAYSFAYQPGTGYQPSSAQPAADSTEAELGLDEGLTRLKALQQSLKAGRLSL